ncbi:protein artichoke-like [Bacillus rossius redtenbacheri]|uniref:protein artichoke-like n=1 Tax=Bacillus rossius redtenbacheri TaxID=93214 RepID=UPI002FDD3F0E
MQRSVLVVAAVLLRLAAGADTRTSCALRNTSRSLTADCRSRSLQEVPSDLPSGLTGLSLSNNHLPALDDQLRVAGCAPPGSAACSRFPRLAQLNITHCATASISSRFLHGSHYLVFLSLSNNQLSSLHQDTFIDNKNLMHLDISHNRISSIPQKLFQGLRYLENLDLSKNQLREIHCETFSGLSNLDALLLNHNNIEVFCETIFGDLTNMRLLNVGSNNLTSLPRNLLRNLSNLEEFLASNNIISALEPTFFSNLHKLNLIVFQNNMLKRLSKYIFQDLLKIREADFSFNKLESLYLHRIPVSLVEQNGTFVLDTGTNICKNKVGTENPCFISELSGNKNPVLFHAMDFSFNKISFISFNTANFSHSLELLNLSLIGNPRVIIPVNFIKSERFITELYLDGVYFNWKNLTLINEIFGLKSLKVLSIIGCGACEYYTKSLLFSIFNIKKTVNILCNDNTTESNHKDRKNLGSLSITSTSNIKYNSYSNKSLQSNSNYLSQFPCEIFESKTIVIPRFDFWNLSIKMLCLHTIDCSFSVVKVLPDMRNSSCVLFSHSRIKNVKENYFQESTSLKYLDLSFNSLSFLPDNMFYSLKNLVILRLEHNMLYFLQSSLFINSTKLIILSLTGNRIHSYAPNVFAPLTQLEILLLDIYNPANLHNKIFINQKNLHVLEVNQLGNSYSLTNNYNSSIKYLSGLISLRLRNFTINSNISDFLSNITGLSEVYFENIFLPEITDEFFNRFTDLNILNIRGNNIEKIGENAFRNLTNIKHIDLSVNKIYILHRNLFLNTIHLEILNISYNKIKNVPVTLFHKLTLLKLLDISNNLIVELEWFSFSYLYSIRGLKLNNNMITKSKLISFNKDNGLENQCAANLTKLVDNSKELSKHILSSEQPLIFGRKCHRNLSEFSWERLDLTVIDLSNNEINFVSNETFMDSPTLQHLFLSRNNITGIDNDTFKYTPLLKNLFIDNNSLIFISETLFKNLTQLELLDLSHNSIEIIKARAFEDLKSLEALNLQFNRLKTFNAKSYFSENMLTSLFLNDNLIMLSYTNFLGLDSIDIISLHNNVLGSVPEEMFELSHNLGSLVIKNCSILTLHPDAFQNNPNLTVLLMNKNPVHSLTPRHFSYLRDLIYLDMSNPKVIPGSDALYAGLSWKNMTLLNYFFELFELQYFILAGNPICEQVQWAQIINNIFLSEKWRTVVCSEEFIAPPWYVNSKGYQLSYNIDKVTHL